MNQWLDLYGESHQNQTNKLVHWLCVPVITWTVIAILWQVQLEVSPWLNLGMLFIAGALGFYWRLSKVIALGMAVFATLCVLLILLYQQQLNLPLWQGALMLFVIAWIGQFLGHKVEGKKPSFLQDLAFLLIGPAWLMSFIFKKLNISY